MKRYGVNYQNYLIANLWLEEDFPKFVRTPGSDLGLSRCTGLRAAANIKVFFFRFSLFFSLQNFTSTSHLFLNGILIARVFLFDPGLPSQKSYIDKCKDASEGGFTGFSSKSL